MAVEDGLAIEAHGREADDYLRIWATEAMKAGDPYVIMSIDKDLKCIPGKHYNIKHEELSDVSDKYALRFFYQQLLSGDPTDNIPGVLKIGLIKVEKYLLNTETEEEMQEIVVTTYLEAYGESWYDYLLSNGKMIYLQKDLNDYFSISHWPVVQTLHAETQQVATEACPDAPLAAAPCPTPMPSPKVAPAQKLNSSPKPFTGVIPKVNK
jgi:5'-3' exonuclease